MGRIIDLQRKQTDHHNVTVVVCCMHAVTKHDQVKEEWGGLAAYLNGEPQKVYTAYPLTSAGGRCTSEDNLTDTLETFKALGIGLPVIGLSHHYSCAAKKAGTRKHWPDAAILTRRVLDENGFDSTRIFRFPLLEDGWLINRLQLQEVIVSRATDNTDAIKFEDVAVPSRPKFALDQQSRVLVASAGIAAAVGSLTSLALRQAGSRR